MLARFAARATWAGHRPVPATIRCHSSSSSATAARVIHMAAQAKRPAAVETVLPATWIACAALGYAAWNRMSECTGGDNVEKLLVV